jgi:predicted CopG family antitoxin
MKMNTGGTPMPKTLTLRVDDETYEAFVKRAKAENRSVANFIESAVKRHIQEHDFVDDVEMAAILANERLVERLKRGSREAKQRKGNLVG